MGPLDGVAHLGDGAVALDDVDTGGGVGRQRRPRRPPADVPAVLHAGELDLLDRRVGVGSGGAEVVAEPGDGEHPAAAVRPSREPGGKSSAPSSCSSVGSVTSSPSRGSPG